MTDRLKGCTVVFANDIREDDAEALLSAIRMIKGVAVVNPVLAGADDMITEMRLEGEFSKFLFESAIQWRDRHRVK